MPSFLAGSDDDKPLAAGQDPPSSGVVSYAAVAPSAVASAVLFEAKSASGARFSLLTNQQSAAVGSNRVAQSTSAPKSESSDFKRLRSH